MNRDMPAESMQRELDKAQAEARRLRELNAAQAETIRRLQVELKQAKNEPLIVRRGEGGRTE